MKIAPYEQQQQRRVMTLCRFCPGEIFFPQQPLRGPSAAVASLKNERIARQSDSHRGVLARIATR